VHSMNQSKKYYLICYDIESTKKRTKLAKTLETFGIRVQKSVFEAFLDEDFVTEMVEAITPYVSEQDTVRIYELSKRAYNNKMVIGTLFDYIPQDDIII